MPNTITEAIRCPPDMDRNEWIAMHSKFYSFFFFKSFFFFNDF